MESVLSIDLGTTTLKAGVVDQSGVQRSLVRREIPLERPEAGAAEHDPDKLLAAVIETASEAVRGSGCQPGMVVLCTYQFGLLFEDADGRPLGGMSTLLDTRARDSFREFRAAYDPAEIYRRTGCPPFFQYPLVRCAHFRRTRTDIWSRIARIQSSKSFLTTHLTGRALSDPSTDSATQLLNLRMRDWDPELLAIAGLRREQMPELHECEDKPVPLLARWVEQLGLRKGAVLAAGVYDGAAIGIGLGVCEPGEGVVNLGTSGMLRVVTREPLLDSPDEMRFQNVCFPGGNYFAGGGINNGAVVMRFFRDQLGGTPFDEMDGLARRSVAGANGLLFLPYLTGERDWRAGDFLTANLFGLRESHRREDVLRAFMEGVSHCFGKLMREMRASGLGVRQVRAAGGGLRGSELWQEILAASLGCPLEMGASDETALLGNAMVGLVALGIHPDLRSASAALSKAGRRFEPSPDAIAKMEFELSRWLRLRSAVENLVQTG
jgi:gluconokinase